MAKSIFHDVELFNLLTGLHAEELTEEQAFLIINEEVMELLEAFQTGDRVLAADALVDILFATASCADRLGFPMPALWEECVSSNISKVGAPIIDGKLQKGEDFVEPDFAAVLAEAAK